MPRAAFAFVLLAAVAGAAPGASPSLAGVLPTGGTRGSEQAVTFLGDRLADAQEVLVYEPGVTVKSLVVEGPQRVRVLFQIAPDCSLGEHGFRVRTASGVSDLRTFWVGALPVVPEVEPNSAFDAPQAVALNTTVAGVITGEDVDYFVVECKKGQRLAVEVEGMRLGTQFWDPYVAILDSKRFELATSDDAPGLGQDAGCAVVIPADGKYVVQLRESAYGGNAACHYRLHVGNFPRPTAVVPAGGRPGEEVELRFVGDPLGEVKQKVKLPAAANPNHRVHLKTADGEHPAGFRFRVLDLPGVVDTAAAAQPTGAVAGSNPGAFHGVVTKPGEGRFFKFPGKKGQGVDISCYARRLGSPLDTVLHVYQADAKGQLAGQIAQNDDAVGPDSAVRVTLPADGDYFLWVYDHLKKGGADYFFRVEVAPVLQETVTTVPKVDGNNVSNQDRQSVAVPKGGRAALMVTAGRQNWGGPGVLTLPALPPGVTATVDVLDPNANQVPVILEAAPTAAVGATLTPVVVLPTDPAVPAKSRTELDVNFNMGINNTPFHRYFADRVAVAVVEAAPFTVDVVEPKAACPQNGSMNLRVVVTRAAGFKGAVTVYPLWTPPGMGLQGSLTIAPDANEGFLSLNAAGNAGVKAWKTAVTASADAGKGPVWTSSKLFALAVGPPVLTLAQERAAVDQGQKTQVVCKVDVQGQLDAPATVKLLGLPAKATAADKTVAKDTKEIVFDVVTDKLTPAGKHAVFCQVTVVQAGETLTQGVGGAELRVDVPLPPKVQTAAAPPKPAEVKKPVEAAKPVEKRLSRLEQLRKEQEEREKAGKPAPPEPKPAEPKKP